ncbi:MAG: hypothetical protein UV61_C0006G0107 [Candidatus Gottesmanbacteria bacterium GW2011_GWB1_43_11]|uniref:HTH cro/C1-type domain-containing protein n=1 Tax=Candidatus Gottesmanbacteria bacterium GW2011_GWB1_43_11 TaxID=1618446 RepID=A0A0G1EV45_9BACT|nr:MAG: hypothetical protein UV04_C0005G0106 [Candidatus Gottesmanbacteria bacterium GW2011_GWA2_42_16]KKS55708.1 MAG: hypothetical protein UV17_C0008G0059 [Candidatus Gottesmanbacteria bacterium GW2011_GWA1_42_26]KKS81164.1 MAG: hypothetical protein UV55_C0019G0020 [Candidatus Gottesmanbacteria bacterium GW2011_GWC1_43_10]KKS86906.1 MAG: hypothetical protein UV61_C0006G0107 [Candidatus Gottesmanbacteria bacterium GW2011_GWB1_43_11]OGG08253.1 MAG: hypothetical protein A2699_06660 [Candidatus Go
MRTVGQLLKEDRLKKGFTLEQVEKATKIRAKFITAIETDNYQKLPAAPYIQGFIKNYSEFLGLSSPTILALFRRQFIERKRQNQPQIEEPLTKSAWQLTPNKVIFVLVVILVLGLLGYFYNQYQALHRPPPLTLENPKADIVVHEEILPVFGRTDPDATVSINQEPILVKSDGRFYKDIPLTLGSNTLVIESTSRIGEKTTLIRRVTRAP